MPTTVGVAGNASSRSATSSPASSSQRPVEPRRVGGVAGRARNLDQLERQRCEALGVDGHEGTTGNVTRDGRSASENTVCSAVTICVCRPIGSPVFGLRSSRGKFDDETSMRIRWPFAKTFDVGGSWMRTRYGVPGSIITSRSKPSRNRVRMIESLISMSYPSG